MLYASANIKYLHTILGGEVLHQLYTLSVGVVSIILVHLNQIILGLGAYFPHVNTLSKQNYMMSSGMRNPLELKLRHYSVRMIDLNYYMDAFPGEKASDKMSETELDEILLKSMLNGCNRQEYVQGFDCGAGPILGETLVDTFSMLPCAIEKKID